ncbi:hypothetical protein ACFVHI_23110 [Kitasatospora sp. NPDC127121]|uniref:hypothetical protein n=1 Tax=unclassified Kitasatospora TaxID=2633591 RepID=UPI003643D5B2
MAGSRTLRPAAALAAAATAVTVLLAQAPAATAAPTPLAPYLLPTPHLPPLPPDAAAVPGAAVYVDQHTATAGTLLTVTLSLTNTESTDINFVYEFLQATWPENQNQNAYAVVSCTGDITDCTHTDKNAALHLNTPIPPGATRTVKVGVQIPADLSCRQQLNLNWVPYIYYEFNNATQAKDQNWQQGLPALQTTILCPAQPA